MQIINRTRMDAVFLVYYNLLVKGNLVTQSDAEY